MNLTTVAHAGHIHVDRASNMSSEQTTFLVIGSVLLVGLAVAALLIFDARKKKAAAATVEQKTKNE
jgi:hypothetical protein